MKRDIYNEITTKIVAAIEAGGTPPWKKPWRTSGFPISLSSGKRYRGINVLLLGMENYGDPRWGTYRAITAAGGQVRKKEKSTQVVLWKPVPKKAANPGEDAGKYMLLKFYSVFNANQADGLPPLPTEDDLDFVPIEEAEKIVATYAWNRDTLSGEVGGPGYRHGGDRACYSPLRDIIDMPDPEHFVSHESYYCTLFHELIHSTGHEKRLKRIEPALFGTDPYAKEELVAEIGASFLSGVAEFESAGGDQSAAYVSGWLEPLKNDPKLIVQAAAQAQKASDLILGTTFEDKKEIPVKAELVTA